MQPTHWLPYSEPAATEGGGANTMGNRHSWCSRRMAARGAGPAHKQAQAPMMLKFFLHAHQNLLYQGQGNMCGTDTASHPQPALAPNSHSTLSSHIGRGKTNSISALNVAALQTTNKIEHQYSRLHPPLNMPSSSVPMRSLLTLFARAVCTCECKGHTAVQDGRCIGAERKRCSSPAYTISKQGNWKGREEQRNRGRCCGPAPTVKDHCTTAMIFHCSCPPKCSARLRL